MEFLLCAEPEHEKAGWAEEGGEDEEDESGFRGEGTRVAFGGVSGIGVSEVAAEKSAEEVAHYDYG